jgi:hypothetical protein
MSARRNTSSGANVAVAGVISGQTNLLASTVNQPRQVNDQQNPDLSISNGTSFNLIDVLSAITMISPFLLAFLMVMISIINSNIKGFIYLLGLIILFVIVLLFQNTLQVPMSTNKICNLFSISKFSVPSFNSALYLYTIAYTFLPMINMGMINFPLIIIFLLFYVSDSIIKYKNKCASLLGIVMGSILGLFFGISWFLLIRSSGQKGLLYYDDLVSNKIACSRPTKQNFKCQVYKNGELIQNI